MDSTSIRNTFLDFFAERGHTVVGSSSLVPDDPTLLFTTSGMVQFKPYFTGEKTPPYLRAASAQKCFRTTDLEIVGKTRRHMTFFEMLGNFSFGDYFKKDAIRWAWELVTERYRLDPERLWATVFETDDESARLWEKEVGLPATRIIPRGREDNFWHMGVAGPCGPNTELLYDRGDRFGEAYGPQGELDEERYPEIYNLVFMQNLQNENLEIVGELPAKGVDTGMGFERVAAILQDVPTVFDTDVVAPIVGRAEQLVGKAYGEDLAIDVSLRVLAEHGRGMAFLIADGVIPSNEDRGYVLRRLIRRAVRYARKASVDEPVLVPLTEAAIDLFKDSYPEVARNRDLITQVVAREEARFDQTLRQGLGTLEDQIARAKEAGETILSGAVAFKLHDTYGFPLDLTRDIAGEEGLAVDLEEFDSLMKSQRERARAARYSYASDATVGKDEAEALERILGSPSKTEFVGYERIESEALVVGFVRNGDTPPVLEEEQEADLILDETPFYPEGGGQIGDRGEIRTESGVFRVEDTRWGIPGLIMHRGKVASGQIRAKQDAVAVVDPAHRDGVRQSHTATHMVHWALRNFLGEHARQQGSLVEPGRLRFDFSHYEAVADDRLLELEEEVNRRVLFDNSVRAFETTYDYAMSIGAIALFGEKYGDFVRVVEVGDYSKELCGGTHVAHTGQVGVVKFASESGVGAGLRRVEAYTGLAGLKYLNDKARKLKRISEMLNVAPERVEERLHHLIEMSRDLEARLTKQRSAEEREEVRTILASGAVRDVAGARFLPLRRDGRQVDDIRRLAQAVRDEMGSGVVVIGTSRDGAANLVAAISKDLVDRGMSARELLSEGAALLGGRAGGKPNLATAGGPNSAEIDKAMTRVEAAVRSALEGRTPDTPLEGRSVDTPKGFDRRA